MTATERQTPPPMRLEEVVGAHVQARREDLGVSQEELGRRLEPYLGKAWTRQGIWAAEHGRRDFAAVELVALAAVLDVPLAWLFVPVNEGQVELREGRSLAAQDLARLAGPESQSSPGFQLRREVLDLREVVDRLTELAAAGEGGWTAPQPGVVAHGKVGNE